MITRINHANTLFVIGIYSSNRNNQNTSFSRTDYLIDRLYKSTVRRQKESFSIREGIERLERNTDKLETHIGELRIQTNSLSRKIKEDNDRDKLHDAKMRKRRKKARKEDLELEKANQKLLFFVGKPVSQIISILCQGTYDTIVNKIKTVFTRITSALS